MLLAPATLTALVFRSGLPWPETEVPLGPVFGRRILGQGWRLLAEVSEPGTPGYPYGEKGQMRAAAGSAAAVSRAGAARF